jgi:RNA polymerase sigma-70 factor (sigma-E family)
MHALDDAEFRDFVAAREHALLRTAFLLTGDQQRAEDLLQTALERAVRHWSSIRSREAVEAYVRRTMYREQVSIWRRMSSRETPSDALPEPRSPDTFVDQVDDHVVLVEALHRLGRRQRTVLVLRYFEDLTEVQVADLLGVSVGTVKSQANRGLARLRSECEPLATEARGGDRR